MTDLDRINARLDGIERMLRELLSRNTGAVPVAPASGILAEIAQVKAAGGDLAAHFKEKARRTMQRDAAEKKMRMSKRSEPKGEEK